MRTHNSLHPVFCTHGKAPVLLAEVLDPHAVVYAPNCRKGRNNLPHTATA